MLVGKGWTDQLQDRRYLMLEGTDGRLHYVPLPPALERIVTARPPRIGDLVALTRSVSVHQGREFVQTKVEGIEIAQSIDGLIYRGRLVGYAHGQDKQRYAVVDIGRDEVLAFPARDATSRPGARCARPVTGLTTAGASSGGSPTQSLSDSGSGAGSGERVTAPAPVSSVRETAMSQGRRHVQTYIGVTDYARLQREAAAPGRATGQRDRRPPRDAAAGGDDPGSAERAGGGGDR